MRICPVQTRADLQVFINLPYRRLHEEVFSPSMRMEINYVLEDNERMNNALLKLGVKPLRKYRVYQKEI